MVTKEQISELPRKYAIGKRPLSRILGWGELTYTRLLEGAVPTPGHEEELLRALNEPLTYVMLLDQAHDSGLVSDSSYARSRKAAESYLQHDDRAAATMKTHAVARCLCAFAKGDVTPHALQLLVYYAHGMSLALLDAPMVEQQPVATDEGPSYEAVASWFTFERIQEAGASADVDSLGLSARELKLLEAVFQQYGAYSGTKLAEMACGESPWRKARKKAAGDGLPESKAVITAKSMTKFFSKAMK